MSTNKNLSWSSPLLALGGSRPSKSLINIHESGVQTIKDLLWIFPLKAQKIPEVSTFNDLKEDELFIGKAKIINIKLTPAFGRRGKNKVQLFNATVVVKDVLSENYLNLKWYNAYPNLKKQLESHTEFTFMGVVQNYKGVLQISNPKINPKELNQSDEFLIQYPTINKVSPTHVKSVINKIPKNLWQQDLDFNFLDLTKLLKYPKVLTAFKVIHGLSDELDYDKAQNIIIKYEFLTNQLKVLARKLKNKKLNASKIFVNTDQIKNILALFPYELTSDQYKVLNDIQNDLKAGYPMMRLIQGDVGCGKTSVALVAALMTVFNKGQVALMCPTEALASQHFQTFNQLLKNEDINISLLLGSTKAKDKKIINEDLLNGNIQLIIGTHSLIQESVQFKKLELAIIDEQHKFGVEQRQKLYAKGNGVHTLIMTATPIPRSLQLAQYGDLDISTIKVMPSGRKGTKTRIVTPTNYDKYLSFIKTRVELGEQVYIVVPAIEESETLDINNISSVSAEYRKYFPEFNIDQLHGQLKPDQKQNILANFENKKIDILISTTVIEVGINIINSTVISIYNPERFGLSSLHQLRGRVGRGEKPGFCFLVTDKKLSAEIMQRLKVIESTTDGFEIAEADLKNRGQGDLFGASQSGHASPYKLANIIEHYSQFVQTSEDIEYLKQNHTEKLNNYLIELVEDKIVSSTI